MPFSKEILLGSSGQSTGLYNGAINQSVRLNGSNTHFRRTLSQGGDRRQATYSFWIKHGDDGNTNYNPIIFSKGNNVAYSDSIYFQIRTTGNGGDIYMRATLNDAQQALIVSNRLFKDPSAWYHFVLAFDTDQSTDTDRMKLYVNGVQETSFSSVAYPSQNADMAFGFHSDDGNNSGDDEVIGDYDAAESSTYHVNGCLAEFHYIDGQQLTQSSFGEFNNGIWIPKEYTGSHGTIGYHLKFDQTGTGTASSTTIGADSSGNNNHFTSSGIAAHDCNFPDTPENNFCTFHPQGRRYGGDYTGTFSEGNLKFTTGGNASHGFGTMAINQVASQGGVYFEIRLDSQDTSRTYVGVMGVAGINNKPSNSNAASYSVPLKGLLRPSAPDGSMASYFATDATSTDLSSHVSTYSNGDVVGVAILSDGKTFFHKNGTYIDDASGNVGNPSTGANPAGTIDLTKGDFVPYVGYNSTFSINFGQDGTFAGQETSGGNSDANGIGDFMFAVPTNCLALCTSNMAEPDIGPNSATQADDHFNQVLFSGTGSSPLSVTGVGFQPDWIWMKRRNGGTNGNHLSYDSSRGGTNALRQNTDGAESQFGNMVVTFASDGFSFTGTDGLNADNTYNNVAWNWKANGGTTSSNGDGSITSTVQANTTAGFSIVQWTGEGDGQATVGHGLGAVPKIIIPKNRDAQGNWHMYHVGTDASAPEDYGILLNSTNARSDDSGFHNDTAPTSSVFTVGTYNNFANDYVAYVFADVEGYSKFGAYHGNATTAGPFVYTGFRPAFLLVKNINTTNYWRIWVADGDNNPEKHGVYPNTSDAEDTPSNWYVDWLSNGFKVRASNNEMNGDGNIIVYMAFADQPFKYANAR